MPAADKNTYLLDLANSMKVHWPMNRTVNIAFHGHSVPSGYFSTPQVDPFRSYPHLLYMSLKERYPFAVINAIVTAIGGEGSVSGAARFEKDVMNHRPDLVTIDYGLNDIGLGLERAAAAWSAMTESALGHGAKVILMTPTMDINATDPEKSANLRAHAAQIRGLAAKYGVGLADSFAAFEKYIAEGGALTDLLSWANHPNALGHGLARDELFRWFPVEY